MVAEVTENSFRREILEPGLPVLVEFYAPWCPKCAMMADVVSEFAEENDGKVKVCRINIERSPGLTKRFGIGEVPTFLLFRRGKILGAMTGKVGKERLSQMVNGRF